MNRRKLWEPALNPEDLARFFVIRANAGEVDGLVALYEPDAVLAGPEGHVMRGIDAIRHFYARLLADRPMFQAGDQRPGLAPRRPRSDLVAPREWQRDGGGCPPTAGRYLAVGH